MTTPRLKRASLTEPQAWRLIAEKIASGNWRMDGLCLEVDRFAYYDGAKDDVYRAMCDRLDRHREPCTVYAFTPGEADVRVLAALFLALEAEDE